MNGFPRTLEEAQSALSTLRQVEAGMLTLLEQLIPYAAPDVDQMRLARNPSGWTLMLVKESPIQTPWTLATQRIASLEELASRSAQQSGQVMASTTGGPSTEPSGLVSGSLLPES